MLLRKRHGGGEQRVVAALLATLSLLYSLYLFTPSSHDV